MNFAARSPVAATRGRFFYPVDRISSGPPFYREVDHVGTKHHAGRSGDIDQDLIVEWERDVFGSLDDEALDAQDRMVTAYLAGLSIHT